MFKQSRFFIFYMLKDFNYLSIFKYLKYLNFTTRKKYLNFKICFKNCENVSYFYNFRPITLIYFYEYCTLHLSAVKYDKFCRKVKILEAVKNFGYLFRNNFHQIYFSRYNLNIFAKIVYKPKNLKFPICNIFILFCNHP